MQFPDHAFKKGAAYECMGYFVGCHADCSSGMGCVAVREDEKAGQELLRKLCRLQPKLWYGRKHEIMEYILVMGLAAILAWAVRSVYRKMKYGGGCCGEHQAVEKKRVVKDRNPSHYPYLVELTIAGMTCENCARRVENALDAQEGVWAKVDISNHRAKVRLKTPPDETALRQASDTSRVCGDRFSI